MLRIFFIVLRMNFQVIYYLLKFGRQSKDIDKNRDEIQKTLDKACKTIIRTGRVTVDVVGKENIPEKDGFIFYPNHQGMFDVFMFLAYCGRSFAFVIKKEARNIPVVKQVIRVTGSLTMDRQDIKQSVSVIKTMTEGVLNGRNYLIFAEGTRSKEGNKLLPFKGGSFKAATKAKCPIVPCAIIDSYRPFDEKGYKPLKTALIFLPAIYYDEYKDMSSAEIADTVKSRIENAIEDYLSKRDA